MKTHISDLIDIIHSAIIKEEKENTIILNELKSIDKKIKSGKLKNYTVDNVPLFKTIINHSK